MPAARARIMIAVGLALACGAPVGRAAPPTVAARAGAIVFLACLPRTALPLAVGDLRDAAQSRVDAVLQATGRDVVPATDMVARAGAARVRNGLVLPQEFLGQLHGDAGVTELYLVHVVVAADRLYVLARSVDTAGGSVGGVWLDERSLDPPLSGDDLAGEGEALRRAVDEALAVLAEPAPPPPAFADPVLVLPAEAVGCGPEEALVATHALLHQLRVAEGATVIDPATALGVLYRAGHDPRELDAAGRARLREQFAVDTLIRPSLVSYDDPAPGVAFDAAWDDLGAAVAPSTSASSFSFTLKAVDLRSGLVTAAADVHHRASNDLGLFGRRREVSRLAEARAAAGAVWTDLRTDRGDS